MLTVQNGLGFRDQGSKWFRFRVASGLGFNVIYGFRHKVV